MRNFINTFRPSQPDPRLQTQSGQHSLVARTNAPASASRSANNPSTRHLQDFAKLSATSLRANVLLNSDDGDKPIHRKSPSALLKAIDDNIEQTARDWGCSEPEVEAMLGSSKRFNAPVCGVTANNVMKLFLDDDRHSYSFEKGHSISLSQLQHQLAKLPADKHFILRVNDGGMGHAYVIDLPASAKPHRDAFLYQSDLGDGATRPLRVEDWMSRKAAHPIALNDINKYFNNMASGKVDPEHIAKLFDIDGNVKMLRPERLNVHKNNSFNFQLAEYYPKNIEKNMTLIKSRCA